MTSSDPSQLSRRAENAPTNALHALSWHVFYLREILIRARISPPAGISLGGNLAEGTRSGFVNIDTGVGKPKASFPGDLAVGSIYLNQAGGAGATLFVKEGAEVPQLEGRWSSSAAIRLCPHGSERAAFPHSAPPEVRSSQQATTGRE